ncbi:MAG: SAM-dependent methyltransferase [Kangiellaceae bacterium]|nr:SAM-dependent methyltransferase [Kangiellaceae bacterium]|tara:strand:+ start:9292 stop:10509 length:1218 start_codon:yes stop_codon:yes gene_type:complete
MPKELLAERWHSLDRILTEHVALWQVRAFEHAVVPWRDDFPALFEHLSCLPIERLDELALDHLALKAELAAVLDVPWLTEIDSWWPVEHFSQTSLNQRVYAGIPGRKCQQIAPFAASCRLDTADRQPLVLEWCAGKGYLGRHLAHHYQARVFSVEWQQALTEAGQQFADAHQLPMQFQPLNVLESTLPPEQWRSFDHAVALHACGDLHQRFFEQCVEHQVPDFTCSPCCYHLTKAERYQPLAQLCQSSQLSLSRYDLRLAIQEFVTGGNRERRIRETEVLWRLAFDRLQRDVRGVDAYLNLPNVKKSVLSTNFQSFCYWAAEQKELCLPANIDYAFWLELAQQQRATVAVMEVARLFFRQALEYWLVLDRALYIQQQGYEVHIGRFCEKQVTPRNLYIRAKRSRV